MDAARIDMRDLILLDYMLVFQRVLTKTERAQVNGMLWLFERNHKLKAAQREFLVELWDKIHERTGRERPHAHAP